MFRKLLLLLSLSITCCVAQTPAPFVGLLTSQTDLTTSGPWAADVWFTSNGSGVPGNNLGPLANSTKVDAVFGTTSYRFPIITDPPLGTCASLIQGIAIDYSKVTPVTRDGNYVIIPDVCGDVFIFKSHSLNGTYPYDFLRRVQLSSTTGGFVANGEDWCCDESDWTVSQDAANPDFVYYLGRKVNNGNRVELKKYNIVTDTYTVLFDFSTIIAGYSGATSVDNFREGNPTEDDNLFTYMVTDNGGTQYGAVVYDKGANAVTANKTVGASGICATAANPTQTCNAAGGFTDKINNWIGFCGDGTTTSYILMNRNNVASRPWLTTIGNGTWVYDRNFNLLGIADWSNGHADCMRDKNGFWLYVTIPFETFHLDASAIAMVRLDMVSVTPPATNNPQWAGMRSTGLPCLWNFLDTSCTTNRPNVQGFTISGRGSHGTQQGYMMFSNFYSQQNSAGASLQGSGGWGALENDLLLLDWNFGTAPGTGIPNPINTLFRVSRTHAINQEYFTQADGVCNWNCTQVFYTTSFDINNGPVPAQMASNMLPTSPVQQQYHGGMMIQLPIGTTPPVVGTPVASPSAGTYIGTQNVAISGATSGAVYCFTTDGSTPTTNGGGICTHGATYSGPITVALSLTLKVIGTKSGSTDSGILTSPYIINSPTTTITITISGGAAGVKVNSITIK